MPVKKTASHAKKPVNKTVEESIAAAVQSIPNLVAKEVPTFPKVVLKNVPETAEAAPDLPRSRTIPPAKPVARQRMPAPSGRLHAEHKKKLLLWSGVSLFTAVIFTFWIINTRTVLSAIRSQGNPEAALVSQARGDALTIVAAINANADLLAEEAAGAEALASVEGALSEIFSSLPATVATSTSSTPESPSASSTIPATTAATSSATTAPPSFPVAEELSLKNKIPE